MTARPTVALLVSLAAGCAGIGGARIPPKGSDDYTKGPWPDARSLPVKEMDRSDVDEIVKSGQELCSASGGKRTVAEKRLRQLAADLGAVWTTDAASTALAAGIGSLMGLVEIQQFGLACEPDGIQIVVNAVALGPYDTVWEESHLGGTHSVVAFSRQRRELLHLTLDPRKAGNSVFVWSELDRYLPEGTTAGVKIGVIGLMEAVFRAPDKGDMWFARTSGAALGQDAPATMLSRAKVGE